MRTKVDTNTLAGYGTTGVAARVLNISEAYTRKLADKGLIRHVRTIGGLRLLDLEDVHRLAEERRARGSR